MKKTLSQGDSPTKSQLVQVLFKKNWDGAARWGGAPPPPPPPGLNKAKKFSKFVDKF